MLVSRLASCAIVVAMLAGVPRARACDLVAKPDTTCLSLQVQGVKGTWFRLDMSQELLRANKLVTELSIQIHTFEDLDKERVNEITALRGALDAETAANAKLKVDVEAAVKAEREAQETAAAAQAELDRWWRSPIVWLAVGLTAGALAGIAIAH